MCCDFVPDALQLQSIFAPCITLSFCSCSTLHSRTTTLNGKQSVHAHRRIDSDEHDTSVLLLHMSRFSSKVSAEVKENSAFQPGTPAFDCQVCHLIPVKEKRSWIPKMVLAFGAKKAVLAQTSRHQTECEWPDPVTPQSHGCRTKD